MSEIPEASPIRTILPADKHAKDQRKKRGPDARHDDGDAPSGDGESRVVLGVMDVPEEDLSPRVRDTLTHLTEELGHLRQELDRARAHILYLEELSEAHTFLPLINRRGLHRELSRLLALGERAGVVNSFVCFHVRNIEDIRRRFGHNAAQAGLVWAAERLMEHCRDTDVVGSLGGHDFGIILTLADNDGAREKATVMEASLTDGHFPWDGERLNLKVVHGLHSFRPGDNAETVIQAADEDLLRRERE